MEVVMAKPHQYEPAWWTPSPHPCVCDDCRAHARVLVLGVPVDMTAADAIRFSSLPDDDDSRQQVNS
jgi:hypothetical protein